MPQTRYTLRDISDLIATVEKRPEEPIFNQLKGLAGRGILQPIPDHYGKKGALLFPEKEVYRARMLLAALDRNLASGELAKFDAQMRFEAQDVAAIYSFDAAASDLLAAYESPEKARTWVFEVGYVRIDGVLGFSGHWIVNNRRRAVDPDWTELRHGFEGVTTFPFTNLLAPIMGAIRRSEG
ncbi:hypothetical protein [Gemmobacter serpentinus]|uniref:hypothetical protein n=1 Tax=Gemmobacter serpentinus TaxID=2652247 RepID=UPI00124F4F7A|nr:hypothetical protein [Gemmobacter serpentinus]